MLFNPWKIHLYSHLCYKTITGTNDGIILSLQDKDEKYSSGLSYKDYELFWYVLTLGNMSQFRNLFESNFPKLKFIKGQDQAARDWIDNFLIRCDSLLIFL